MASRALVINPLDREVLCFADFLSVHAHSQSPGAPPLDFQWMKKVQTSSQIDGAISKLLYYEVVLLERTEP